MQYTFDRTGEHPLACYMKEKEQDIPEEREEQDSLNESTGSFTRPHLSDLDEGGQLSKARAPIQYKDVVLPI